MKIPYLVVVSLATLAASGCGNDKKSDSSTGATCNAPTATVTAAADAAALDDATTTVIDTATGCPVVKPNAAIQPDDNMDSGGGTVAPSDVLTCEAGQKPIAGKCIAMTIVDAKSAKDCHALSGFFFDNTCHTSKIVCGTDSIVNANGESCATLALDHMINGNDCATHDGYWYDVADVTKTTAAGFAALSPSCHAGATIACPSSGLVGYARVNNDSILTADAGDTAVYASYSNIVEVLSPIRCLLAVTDIDLSHNDIPAIDVRANVAVTFLNLAANHLTKLDVGKNVQIQTLLVADNAFAQPVDLSHNAAMPYLAIGNAGAMTAGSVNYASMPSLNAISLDGGPVTTADLNTLPSNLSHISVNNTDLTSLDARRFTSLTLLEAHGCSALTSINVSGMTSLQNLWVWSNNLSAIDVTTLTNLRDFEIDGNHLSTIDLTHNNQLRTLWLSGSSSITSLDLSHNMLLQDLHLESLGVTGTLNLAAYTHLVGVHLEYSQWSAIDLTGAAGLLQASLYGMSNYALNFANFNAAFINLSAAGYGNGIYIEDTKWAAATGTAPTWANADVEGNHTRYYP